jgi:hypothetical protein
MAYVILSVAKNLSAVDEQSREGIPRRRLLGMTMGKIAAHE